MSRSYCFAFCLALLLAAAPTRAAIVPTCVLIHGIDDVEVQLMPAPVAGSNLTANEAELMRREHAHISSSVATQLGIRSVAPEVSAPSPQLRVLLEEPDNVAGSRSFAVFTVTGIFYDGADRIRIYQRVDASDTDAGAAKLFAGYSTDPEDLPVDADGWLTTVRARVLITPVSKTTITGLSPGTTTYYCESNDNSEVVELAHVAADARLLLLAPHGGSIETKTSEQMGTMASRLTALGVTPSSWDLRSTWGGASGQAHSRFHVKSTAIDPISFPALRTLLARPDHANTVPFRYVLALHGMSGTTKSIVVGGQADRQAKCLVAKRVRDELQASRGNRNEIGFRIVDIEGDLTVGNAADIPVGTGLGGMDGFNLTNRFSLNSASEPGWGGIQLEQSKTLRDDATNPQGLSPASNGYLRNVVARGVANALSELVAMPNSSGPTNACSTM